MHKTVSIYHANLNCAFLQPHKCEQVFRASYETILDGHEATGPHLDGMRRMSRILPSPAAPGEFRVRVVV